MNAEKYVNDIVGKIKCTEVKKKEIKIQLLSDISARMEQGESLEQIMAGMGTAQEIADAFLQDLPESEKKARRRKQIGIISAAVILGVLLLGYYIWWIIPKPVAAGEDEVFSMEVVTMEVEQIIGLLNENDFDTLQKKAVDKLQKMLTQESIDKGREMISDDWGQMQGIGTVYAQGIIQRGKFMVVTQVDATYENVRVVYTITFDEEMKLSGLYMR